MEEWKSYLMEDVIEEIAMGPFGSNIKVDCFVDSGVPVLNGSNLQGFKLNEESFNYVTEEKANSLNKANAHRGDIVITHRGTLGQIVYIPSDSQYERYVISQSQFRVRLNTQIALPQFVVYFFHTRIGQHRLLANASQVGVPAIARPSTTFKKVLIELPSIKVQERIVRVLDSLSRKIDNNNRISHNLEEQAKALFKSWFVDFDPFQERVFIDSEIGMIPKGWIIGSLKDIAVITMGTSPSGKSYNTNGVGDVFYQGRAEFGNRFPSRNLFTTEARRFAEENSVLLSVRAPVGDINVAEERCCIGRGLASIQSLFGTSSYLLYCMHSLQTELNKFNGEGTVFGSINKKDLEGLRVLIPPKTIMQEFDALVRKFDMQILELVRESRTLKTLRDTLLPKLMSGEIAV